MRKKLFVFITLLCAIQGFFLPINASSIHSYCAFCDPKVLENQTFYEDELVLALYTHKPVMPGHCLIIPKRHIERFEDATDDEIKEIGALIKKVNKAVMKVFGTHSYLLLQKNGTEVGQTVPHVHFHYIPRKKGDSSEIGFIFNMYLANIKAPISQEKMRKITTLLKEAMLEN